MFIGTVVITILNKKDSPRVGKFTHPSGAGVRHLATLAGVLLVKRMLGTKAPA